MVTMRGMAPRTAKAYKRIVGLWDAAGRPDPQVYVAEIGGAPSTITSRLAAIKGFCKFLRIPDATFDVPRPKRIKGIPRPVADVEARIAAFPDQRTRWIAVFLLETGLRIAEACSLDIDLPVPDAVIVRGKGSKDRLVPLTARAQAALTALGGRMPWKPREIQRKFAVQGFSPHKLRHTFACQLAEAEAELGEVQDLLGHSSPATTRVYMHYSPKRLRRATEKRAAMFGGAPA